MNVWNVAKDSTKSVAEIHIKKGVQNNVLPFGFSICFVALTKFEKILN